jgi:signal peptidase II
MADSVNGENVTPRFLGLCAAVLALVADQGCKLALLHGAGFNRLPEGARIPVLPFFDLTMVWNPGISYGLFPVSGAGTLVLLAVVSAVIALMAWWLWHTTSTVVAIGCGLVIGGGMANNLVDRLIYGKVADFFHFHAFGYDWYVFNIADVAVTLGAVAFIYDVLKPPESAKDA